MKAVVHRRIYRNRRRHFGEDPHPVAVCIPSVESKPIGLAIGFYTARALLTARVSNVKFRTTLTGQGTLSAPAKAKPPLTLTGQGRLSAVRTVKLTARLTGRGALSGSPNRLGLLAGQGVLTGRLASPAALHGHGALTAGIAAVLGPMALAGNGALTNGIGTNRAVGLTGRGVLSARVAAQLAGTITGRGVLAGGFGTGSVYVAAGSQVLQLTGTTQTTLGLTLGAASGLALDASGNLYISDNLNAAVYKWNGSTQTTEGFTGLATPSGVDVDSSGNIYVADYTNHAVYKLAGATQTTIGFTGLTNPIDVAVDGAGNIYVADSANKAVYKWNGTTQTTVGFTGLNSPQGLAVDNVGNIYVADFANAAVYKYNVAGSGFTTFPFTFPTVFGSSQSTVGFTGLAGPFRLAIDNTGNIYVSDFTNNAVYLLAGSTQATVAFTGLSSPRGVAVIGAATTRRGAAPTGQGRLAGGSPIVKVAGPLAGHGTLVGKVPPQFDAIGAGIGVTVRTGSYTHTAAAGAKVFLFIAVNGSTAPAVVTFGGTAMSWLGQVNPTGSQYQYVYYLPSAPGGASTVLVTISTVGTTQFCANSISVNNVTSIASPQLTTGSGSPLSQSVSGTLSQFIVQSFQEIAGQGITAYSGGTSLWSDNPGLGGSSLTLSTAASTTTFTATDISGLSWSGLALVLS